MTVPVAGIGNSRVVERRDSRDNSPEQRMRHGYQVVPQDDTDELEAPKDTISISTEAKQRSSGAWRKSILEHLQSDE